MSKLLMWRLFLLSILLVLVLTSCARAEPTPVAPTETKTPFPTLIPSATLPPTVSNTPYPTDIPTATRTPTPTPTLVPLATRTPLNTATPVVSITPTPRSSATRAAGATRVSSSTGSGATRTPTPRAAGSSVSAVGGGLHGVTGLIRLENRRTTTFAVNTKVWFVFELTNATGQPLPYGVLGVVAIDLDPSDGNGRTFHTSWDGNLAPNGQLSLPASFRHRDNITIATPGAYQLFVTMCFSDFNTCYGGGDWENLSGPLDITIQ